MEVFIWSPWRIYRNSQCQYNMKQPSAGQSAAEFDSTILGQQPPFWFQSQPALSVMKGSKPLYPENEKLQYQLHKKWHQKTSAGVFCWLVDTEGLSAQLCRFLGKHAENKCWSVKADIRTFFIYQCLCAVTYLMNIIFHPNADGLSCASISVFASSLHNWQLIKCKCFAIS